MTEQTETTTKETKKPKGKPSKKPAKAKAAAATKRPAKAEKPKKEKAPREDRTGWGTFALKLPVPERESFHTASGKAGASRFARIVLAAFANEDETAFRNAIVEARKLRA